eukprot:158455-Prorocentrum_lima.AAC.1
MLSDAWVKPPMLSTLPVEPWMSLCGARKCSTATSLKPELRAPSLPKRACTRCLKASTTSD